VLEDEHRNDQVEDLVAETRQERLILTQESDVRNTGIDNLRALDHSRRDVDARGGFKVLGKGTRQPTDPTAEVKGGRTLFRIAVRVPKLQQLIHLFGPCSKELGQGPTATALEGVGEDGP